MQSPASACPHCGAQISANAQFCKACGKPITAEPTSALRTAIPSAERKCLHCGATLSETAQFCKACGKPVAAEPTGAPPIARKCPTCGAALSPNAKFCRACGKAIEPSTAERVAAKPGVAVMKDAVTPTPPVRQSQLGSVVSASRTAMQFASTLSPVTTTTLPLGWRTVVGSALPTIAPLVTQGACSVIVRQTASVGRSLRAPVLGLTVTSFIALVTTLVTQDTTAQLMACLQFGLTVAGLITGLIADKKRNVFSLGTVLATLGVFQVQGFMLCTMVQTTAAAPTPAGLLSLLMNGSTKLLCLVAALGTAWTAARGGK